MKSTLSPLHLHWQNSIGKFVLIKDKKNIGIFSSFEDAHKERSEAIWQRGRFYCSNRCRSTAKLCSPGGLTELGVLTIWPVGVQIQTRPDPTNPGQSQISVALGGGKEALSTKGILVNVAIGVDQETAEALRAQGQIVPNPISSQALVDTGASMLSIDSSIAKSLGLTKRGIVTSHTANGPRESRATEPSTGSGSLRRNPFIRVRQE